MMPALCPVCRAVPLSAGDRACEACREALGTLPAPRCRLCGGSREGVLEICGECLQIGERPWVHAVSAFPFRGAVREAVHRLKYQGSTAVVPVLASAMARDWQCYGHDRLDVVVPVPLHWARQWTRGYNQAELLARFVAGELGLPCERLLRRRRRTAQQAMLEVAERRKNVRGVFAPARGSRAAGHHVLLVDDVLTTGATLGEAARTLTDAAAATVSVLTAARG
jgi:competence protein ComFC